MTVGFPSSTDKQTYVINLFLLPSWDFTIISIDTDGTKSVKYKTIPNKKAAPYAGAPFYFHYFEYFLYHNRRNSNVFLNLHCKCTCIRGCGISAFIHLKLAIKPCCVLYIKVFFNVSFIPRSQDLTDICTNAA